MARGISVYRPEDLTLSANGAWQVREDASPLFDEALGSESSIRESWSEPAATLGLPLLAAVYEHGFYHGIRWAGGELHQVLVELARLEAYWKANCLAPEIAADLAERGRHLRAAVAIAERCGGFVVIT